MGFKALDVYFSRKSSFYYLVGPLSLESAGNRTELSKKSGLTSYSSCHTVAANRENDMFYNGLVMGLAECINLAGLAKILEKPLKRTVHFIITR